MSVIPHLHKAADRKILSQGMPAKAVVGQNPAQIRVIGKADAEHVENLTFKPVGSRE